MPPMIATTIVVTAMATMPALLLRRRRAALGDADVFADESTELLALAVDPGAAVFFFEFAAFDFEPPSALAMGSDATSRDAKSKGLAAFTEGTSATVGSKSRNPCFEFVAACEGIAEVSAEGFDIVSGEEPDTFATGPAAVADAGEDAGISSGTHRAEVPIINAGGATGAAGSTGTSSASCSETSSSGIVRTKR